MLVIHGFWHRQYSIVRSDHHIDVFCRMTGIKVNQGECFQCENKIKCLGFNGFALLRLINLSKFDLWTSKGHTSFFKLNCF